MLGILKLMGERIQLLIPSAVPAMLPSSPCLNSQVHHAARDSQCLPYHTAGIPEFSSVPRHVLLSLFSRVFTFTEGLWTFVLSLLFFLTLLTHFQALCTCIFFLPPCAGSLEERSLGVWTSCCPECTPLYMYVCGRHRHLYPPSFFIPDAACFAFPGSTISPEGYVGRVRLFDASMLFCQPTFLSVGT